MYFSRLFNCKHLNNQLKTSKFLNKVSHINIRAKNLTHIHPYVSRFNMLYSDHSFLILS